MRELRGGAFLENDYPELADALATAGAKVAFADMEETSRAFFARLSLGRLSAACGVPTITTGAECPPPNRFRAQHEAEILTLLKRPDFAVALHRLGWALRSQATSFRPVRLNALKRRLGFIQRIAFVSEIERIYIVAGTSAPVSAEATVCDNRIALLPARNRLEHNQRLARALAEVVGAMRLPDARPLALSILPLLWCQSNADMLAYLRRQGIQPPHWSEFDDNAADGDEEGDEFDARTESALRQVMRSLNTKMPTELGEQSVDVEPLPAIAIQMKSALTPLVLPPLDTVTLAVVERREDVVLGDSSTVHGPAKRRTTAWSPPTSSDVERDRLVGERGEELVYWREIERVRLMGYEQPEKHVTWTSKTDQGADHDIRSIDEDGNPRWIEVKSSMGIDGRFEWPRNEFEKALRERGRYELWRVYQAHTQQPTAKSFRDPTSLLGSTALRLELSALRACVESKD